MTNAQKEMFKSLMALCEENPQWSFGKCFMHALETYEHRDMWGHGICDYWHREIYDMTDEQFKNKFDSLLAAQRMNESLT